ncbi:rho guanine nucleotide exchange factor 12 isoform X2 [Acipenser ruthenus]|uniref:rho guanine nucleotide exchange factor 12 isoform X2 n=1 Tax=Acipenser ruthenus TaxID=7906 RepID=UPI002741A3FC|nr:rho guanine nucleotide exchange factor 12 isoform X2 [Acipenser ruthenus]
MSGSQPTITDRFPIRKPTRHGSILSKDPPPDKKHKSDKPTVSPQEFDPTDHTLRKSKSFLDTSKPEAYGLVQRCVIIQKDDNGFGLTVSGDNPVFVQSVKEDGAAMRAGVQTGDRIIKVNGTLVTHSNHVEVVKLIKSGSYVALTVLGRPPGLPHIPLSESESDPGALTSVTSPNSPGQTASSITAPQPVWHENNSVHNQKVDILQKMLSKELQDLQAMKEEYSRSPTPKLQKEIQEAKKHIPQLQEQLSKATGGAQDGVQSSRPPSESLQISEVEDTSDGDQTLSPRMDASGTDTRPNSGAVDVTSNFSSAFTDSHCQSDTPSHSPKTVPKDGVNSFETTHTEDTPDQNSHFQSSVGSPASQLGTQIIGAEDDYFDTEQEQVNGQCSCFQSMELLKSRPAHLAAFLHHVVSQFDPAPLLCYLYADLYKHTNSKETRRVFMDFNTFFMDRGANLKVAVPDGISSELERRRPEFIPEELHRQYIQLMQDTLLTDIQKNLEDFRQKRSMGLTLAESELTKLDMERLRDRVGMERERSCAEQILSKIEEVLLTSQPTEEEKCTTMQYVILSYMKHLGVKVKEPRNLEHKRGRMGSFLPKIKKSIKNEKEGEEKVKKPRFPSILGQPRRPSRNDSSAIGRAVELHNKRPQKQSSQAPFNIPEHSEPGRGRLSLSSEGSEPAHTPCVITSPPPSAPDPDTGQSPSSAPPRPGEALLSGDSVDLMSRTPTNVFEFPSSPLEHLPEEDHESDRVYEGGTPRPVRRMDTLGFIEVQSEDDQSYELEADPPNWQQLVSRDVLAGLTPHEIKRQEVINELFYTERAHIRTLRVLDQVFYQKLLSRDGILPPAEVKHIFSNLEEILQLHASIIEQVATIRKKNETSVIDQIGDDLLSWFSGSEEEKIKRAAGTFCSNQPFALELIKTRQKKDNRFLTFIQEAESNPLCRRLQLKDIIPTEMQRLTKYPLLLENIAKYTEDAVEKEKVKRAGECCRQILNYVNQAVKESENKQRLEDYQRRLDLSSLKQSEYPMIEEFRNLDLTKRKMIHEGPLTWKVNKDKTIELYTLLLEDILVLLQKQDDRLILKCHSKNLAGTAETKHIFSPVIKLNSVLVRQVATDNKAFFVLSMSDNGAHIYELVAQTVSEQKTWQYVITQRAGSIKTKPLSVIALTQPAPAINDGDREEEEEVSTTAHQKLSKESERISTGSIQSPEKDVDVTSPVALQTTPSSPSPFEVLKPGEGGEGASFPESVLDERPPFMQQRSRQAIAMDDEELVAFDFPPSPYRAEEALKNLMALKQVLLTHLLLEEEGSEEAHFRHRSSAESSRAVSQRGSLDSSVARAHELRSDRASTASEPASPRTPENSPEREAALVNSEGAKVRGEEAAPGEQMAEQFFESAEGYAESYLILEGYGGVGESSTDEDFLGVAGELNRRRESAGDSAIDLKKLLSSSSSSSSRRVSSNTTSELSRQVMAHMGLLQANLHHLKEVETRYNILCQRLAGSASDTEENKEKS